MSDLVILVLYVCVRACVCVNALTPNVVDGFGSNFLGRHDMVQGQLQ